MQTVLHSVAGDDIEIGLLNGPRGIGRIVSIDSQEAVVEVERLQEHPVPQLTVDLICAITRPKILRKVLYVAAMMGVRSLHLIRTNRTEKSYLLSPLLEAENYLPYLLDGLSQGRQTRLPVVYLHPLFRPFVEDELPMLPGFSESPKIVADLGAGNFLDRVLHERTFSQIFLAVGPEGGWVDFERELLSVHGFSQFSLGQATLRVEFALTAALSQIEMVWNGGSRL
jgi:RsmE family RNA methyltransferase